MAGGTHGQVSGMRSATYHKWTEDEELYLVRRYEDGIPLHAVAFEMGLTRAQIRRRFQTIQDRGKIPVKIRPRSRPRPRGMNERLDDATLDERDRRINAIRSLTSTLMGDPPPGYSALDRRA
jgi:predicted ArsR family transcriptional regulator